MFLDYLAEYGLVTLACKHASPHAPLGSKKIFYKERANNKAFREAWDEALEEADDKILKEMHRRGHDGWQEETQWGSVTKYSDKLLEIYAKVKSSKIRNALSSKVEVTNITDTPDLGLAALTPESQGLLKQILENEQKKNDEDPSQS